MAAEIARGAAARGEGVKNDRCRGGVSADDFIGKLASVPARAQTDEGNGVEGAVARTGKRVTGRCS